MNKSDLHVHWTAFKLMHQISDPESSGIFYCFLKAVALIVWSWIIVSTLNSLISC